jgi:acetylglutamate kinase
MRRVVVEGVNADAARRATVLVEALPFMQRYAGATFVIKYGGHAMGDAEALGRFADDIVLMRTVGLRPVIVHGGGPQIGAMLKRLGIESRFVDGLRVTDAATADVAEMVLGAINKEIVSGINRAGGSAVGLSGKDASLVTAEKVTRTMRAEGSRLEEELDLGFVGDPATVDPSVLHTLLDAGITPVIAPVGVGADGATYNINADTMAGAIASSLGAARLFLLTDVAGVLDKNGDLLTDLVPSDVETLVADGTIRGGMIPKIETCVSAVAAGVEAAVIVDGRVPHAMILEVFTRGGAGTLVRAG